MKLTFLKIYLLPLTVLIILGIIVVANKPLASTTQSKQQISVLNKTQTLRVVNAEIVNEDFRLTMRNNSAKSITNFEIGVGNGVTYQTEFLYADVDKAVLPGEEYQQTYSKEQGLRTEGLTILAVIFDDGTSDGEPKIIQEIKDKRTGEKIQRRRIFPLLQNAIDTPLTDARTALQKLESQISSLPIDDNQSEFVKSGLRSGKENMLHKIHKLQENESALDSGEIRDRLLRIKTQQENIISKL